MLRLNDDNLPASQPELAPEERALLGELTPEELVWVSAFLGGNFRGEVAAQACGLAYSNPRATTLAVRLVHRPGVRAVMRKRLAAAGLTFERCLEELRTIALNADPADYDEATYGTATLDDLRQKGIDTRLVKRLTVRSRPTGRKDEDGKPILEYAADLELYDRTKILMYLSELLRLDSAKLVPTDAPAVSVAESPEEQSLLAAFDRDLARVMVRPGERFLTNQEESK